MVAFISGLAIFSTVPHSLTLAHSTEIIRATAPFTSTDESAFFFFKFVLEIRDSNLAQDEFVIRYFVLKS